MNRNKLTVLIQTTGEEDIANQAADELAELRTKLLDQTRLGEISFLRGDVAFCLHSMRTPRDHPVIALCNTDTYADDRVCDRLLLAGVELIFYLDADTETEFIKQVEEHVRTFLTQ